MIYIQGASGLTQISPSLTREKIIAALGYTPADQNTFYEDESGALLVADENGYVIARIDANGLTTTKVSANAIELNGEDLAAKLQALSESSGGSTSVDLSNYYTKEEVDTALSDIDLSDYYTKEEVDTAISNINVSGGEGSSEVLTAHIENLDIHVTADEKTAWNNKSDFSGLYEDLNNAPHIVNENEDEVIICDSLGNIILRATAEGLNVAALYINGKMAIPAYDDTMEGATLQIVNGTPTWVMPTTE